MLAHGPDKPTHPDLLTQLCGRLGAKPGIEIDEATLQEIARRSGGRYFHATDAEGLREVVEEIGRLERSEISEVRYLEYDYHFAPFVAAALVLIALATLLSATWLRRLPA